jgi:hypothetical protein
MPASPAGRKMAPRAREGLAYFNKHSVTTTFVVAAAS